MISDYLEGFLNGALEMAVLETGSTPSMACVFLLDPEDETGSLMELTGLPAEEIALVPEEEDWRTPLRYLFREGEAGDRTMRKLSRLFSFHAGKMLGFARFANDSKVREESSCFDGGWAPYYFTEDLYVAYFENAEALFVIGNDE